MKFFILKTKKIVQFKKNSTISKHVLEYFLKLLMENYKKRRNFT